MNQTTSCRAARVGASTKPAVCRSARAPPDQPPLRVGGRVLGTSIPAPQIADGRTERAFTSAKAALRFQCDKGPFDLPPSVERPSILLECRECRLSFCCSTANAGIGLSRVRTRNRSDGRGLRNFLLVADLEAWARSHRAQLDSSRSIPRTRLQLRSSEASPARPVWRVSNER